MDAAPKIPTLKDSKKPQVKVRGLGAGLNLAERLKQFKKKDLAFILAGLGVLFMAPLAEHFMMTPEGGDGTLKPGWSGPGSSGSGSLGGGGSPYERTDGLAPGGPTGGGADIITPLNVRDPSSLIMGPSAAQQPPTNSALAGTPPGPPSRSDADLKDALAASARGLGAAAKKAPMPLPKVALGGSGLRGLGVAGGGSSASASLGGISAANVPNKASMADSTGNARPTKGYSGVARGQTQGGSGVEALKAAASKQGEGFNRSGSAASDLNAAAQTAIPAGGAGGAAGGPSGGKDDKGFGGNQDKGSKTVGESLAFLEKKSRMEKDLELEYKKKEKNDWELIGADLRNDFLKTMVSKGMAEPIAGAMGDMLKGLLTPNKDSVPGFACQVPPPGLFQPGEFIPASSGYKLVGGGLLQDKDGKNVGSKCIHATRGGKDEAAKPVTDDKSGNVNSLAGVSSGDMGTLANLSDICKKISFDAQDANTDPEVKQFAAKLQPHANAIVSAQVALIGGVAPMGCTAVSLSNSGGKPVIDLLKESINSLAGIGVQDGGLIKYVKDNADKESGTIPTAAEAETNLQNAEKLLKELPAIIGSDIIVSPVPPNSQYIVDGLKNAQKVTTTMRGNLDTCYKAIRKQKEDINLMVGEGTLKKVMAVNGEFSEAGGGISNAPAEGSMPSADGDLQRTNDAIAKAQDKIVAAKKSISEAKTPDALELAKKSLTEAANAVVEMRAAQTGWASAVKKELQAQESFVVSPPLGTVAGK